MLFSSTNSHAYTHHILGPTTNCVSADSTIADTTSADTTSVDATSADTTSADTTSADQFVSFSSL